MKRITLATAVALLFSANVMAATEVSSHQADGLQSVGFVTLNQNLVSPDDASSQVSKLADQRGATAYRIIALHEPNNNSTIHVSAELYR